MSVVTPPDAPASGPQGALAKEDMAALAPGTGTGLWREACESARVTQASWASGVQSPAEEGRPG